MRGEHLEAFALVLQQAFADLRFRAAGIDAEQPTVEVFQRQAEGLAFLPSWATISIMEMAEFKMSLRLMRLNCASHCKPIFSQIGFMAT